jgi:hypothetical protein
MNDVATAASAAPSKIVPFFELSRLMVVAVLGSNNRLVYKAQTKPNGPWEANWSPIDTTQTFGWIAAGISGDGRVAVVGQRASGTPGVSYIIEAPDSLVVQRWNPPVDLGKPAPANNLSQLAIIADADGRLEVFALDAIGTDPGGARIWWKYQNPNRVVQKQVKVTPPGTHEPITITVEETAPPLTPWSDWFQIPGGLVTILAKRNADGRVILFGANSNGHLYRNEQKVAQALKPADWAGWVQMDDTVTKTFGVFSATLDRLGAMNLFALAQGGQVFHARQAPPATATWAGWTTPGFIREGVQGLAANIDGDGDIVLVATDKTRLQHTNQQRSAESQQWTGWIAFNIADQPTQLALDYNADGRLSLFSHALPERTPPFGGLRVASQMKLDSTEWELAQALLADSDIRVYAVVRDLTPPT